MITDPLQALASLILGFNKEKNIQKWMKLLFEVGFSMLGTFLFVCGTSLSTGAKTSVSVGLGMISSSIILFSLLRRSELTKGMTFMAPAKEAEAEINTDVQVIIRNK